VSRSGALHSAWASIAEVDPETWAAMRGEADRQRWYFLTGQRDQVIKLIRDGFHLSVAALRDSGEANGMIPHSPRFVLIDQQAQIRGYYDSRAMDSMARLRNDIATLLKG